MDKIKVCHIITLLELGGAQRNTLHTVASLDRGVFAPLLICGEGGFLDDEAKTLRGVKTYFVPQLVRQISPLKDIGALFALYRILREEKPDIVHTHSSKAGILGRIAAKLAGVPVIIHTYHGYGFHDFQKAVVKQMYVLAERFVAPMTTRFIAVAKEDISKGLKNGIGPKEKFSLIRSGIDLSRFTAHGDPAYIDDFKQVLNIAAAEKVVTTIGPFKPQKNLADFIKVCGLVAKEMPGTRFLVVGDGEQRPMLEELIVKLGLPFKVDLLGWRKDIQKILVITDVFVLTSLWEGLPRSILEAMSSGVPVVANAVDGVKEMIEDGKNGFLINPGDIETCASKIVYLLTDDRSAAIMGQNGKISIGEQFDINVMVRQQERLYLSLMEKPKKH